MWYTCSCASFVIVLLMSQSVEPWRAVIEQYNHSLILHYVRWAAGLHIFVNKTDWIVWGFLWPVMDIISKSVNTDAAWSLAVEQTPLFVYRLDNSYRQSREVGWWFSRNGRHSQLSAKCWAATLAPPPTIHPIQWTIKRWSGLRWKYTIFILSSMLICTFTIKKNCQSDNIVYTWCIFPQQVFIPL